MTDSPTGCQLVEHEFDWDETPPSVAIAYTLASLENIKVEDLPSLYEYVNPESIDTLVREGEDVLVSVAVREYVVEITDDHVSVYTS